MKQTKIVCTISDQHCEQDFLRHLFFAGMNVVRMNTAHATPEGIRKIIRNTRAVTPHLALLIDTKGPEVRTTGVKEPIAYKTDEQVAISGHPDTETTHDHVCVSCTSFANDVKVGDDVLFDDGALAMKVVGKEGDTLTARVLNDGTLGAHKSVNVPGEHIDLPALSDRDKRMIRLAIDQDIDFIAHSFVRSAKDVHAVQRILDAYHSDIKIISKIENQEGVDNIDEIIDASYGIMIARGDLGIEVPIEQIPGIQRRIIEKCIRKHKPVIVATQMLQTASHPDFQLLAQTAHVCFHSRKRVHTRLSEKNRTQGHTRRNRGVLDGGGITTLGAFRTFTNIPGPGIRTASFAAFGAWSGVLPKNAESLRDSDVLMRVAVP